MLALRFDPSLNILIDAKEYLGASGLVVSFPNADKGITALSININIENFIFTSIGKFETCIAYCILSYLE